jgi:hypothetical protein
MSVRAPRAADRRDAGRRADSHSRCAAVTTRDRLAFSRTRRSGRAAQKPLDIGLCDEATRNQLDLF